MNFVNHLYCPNCRKGEVIADAEAEGCISVRCPVCRRVFVCDLGSKVTFAGTACRKEMKKDYIS